jgi:hypothetical protein
MEASMNIETQGKLPETASEALKKAAQVEPSKADPLARVKAVERAAELSLRLYTDHFKGDSE